MPLALQPLSSTQTITRAHERRAAKPMLQLLRQKAQALKDLRALERVTHTSRKAEVLVFPTTQYTARDLRYFNKLVLDRYARLGCEQIEDQPVKKHGSYETEHQRDRRELDACLAADKAVGNQD